MTWQAWEEVKGNSGGKNKLDLPQSYKNMVMSSYIQVFSLRIAIHSSWKSSDVKIQSFEKVHLKTVTNFRPKIVKWAWHKKTCNNFKPVPRNRLKKLRCSMRKQYNYSTRFLRWHFLWSSSQIPFLGSYHIITLVPFHKTRAKWKSKMAQGISWPAFVSFKLSLKYSLLSDIKRKSTTG